MAATCLIAAGILPPAAIRAQQPVSDQETHDRIVALIIRHAGERLPKGDTFVSWYGNPILYHTVQRSDSQLTTGMARADGMVGLASVTWSAGRIVEARSQWTRGDRELASLVLTVSADSIRLSGTASGAWPVPAGAWAVADYGMEDLVLPSLLPAPGPFSVAVYRPYAAKWDSLRVMSRNLDGGSAIELVGPNGTTDWWLVSNDRDLLSVRRSGQEFERRPLELSRLVSAYRRLRAQSTP